MEIRKMAELYALYPEAQPGIRYDSPELLMMQYISEGFIARFEADGLTILPEFPAGAGRKSQDTL